MPGCRMTSSLMQHGRNNGKKLMAVRIIKHSFDIIHLLTDQNPIQVLVDAIINRCAQRQFLCTAGVNKISKQRSCFSGLHVCARSKVACNNDPDVLPCTNLEDWDCW